MTPVCYRAVNVGKARTFVYALPSRLASTESQLLAIHHRLKLVPRYPSVGRLHHRDD